MHRKSMRKVVNKTQKCTLILQKMPSKPQALPYLYPEDLASLQQICNFAGDMTTNDNLTVGLREVEKAAQTRTLHLADDFFQHLDQEEIVGGDVDVNVSIRPAAGESFRFSYHIKGTVRVICDRCLEEVGLPVDFSEVVKVCHDDSDEDYGEAVVIPSSQLTYDMSWDIYELIDVNLPLQRIHPDGLCDPDMISRFSIEEDSDTDDDF